MRPSLMNQCSSVHEIFNQAKPEDKINILQIEFARAVYITIPTLKTTLPPSLHTTGRYL